MTILRKKDTASKKILKMKDSIKNMIVLVVEQSKRMQCLVQPRWQKCSQMNMRVNL